MDGVMTLEQLLHAVDVAFEETGREMAPWPDPHPDRSPAEDEYSRVTDAARYRILVARVDAWIAVLTAAGLAELEADVDAVWRVEPGTRIGRADRLVPIRPDALALVVARSCIDDVDDAGITIGAGDPALLVAIVPDCGCDACDSGSSVLLDELDGYLLAVVAGVFRRLTSRDREITELLDGQITASSRRGMSRATIDRIRARPPRGWTETSGAPWLDVTTIRGTPAAPV